MKFLRLFHPKHYYYRYLIGMAILIIGLPFSKFLMSVAQFYLLANWLFFYRNPLISFQAFLKNKPALILSGIYIIHLLGMLYSEDLNYGLDELRKKLPLFFLPVIVASSPLIQKYHLKQLLNLFIITVFASSLVSLAIFMGITGKEIIDIRQISIFVSHIRFALMICFSALISIYFFLHETSKLRYLYLYFLFWMVAILILLESITGLVILMLCSFLLISYYIIIKGNKKLKIIYFLGIIITVTSLAVYFNNIYQQVSHVKKVDYSLLDKQSASGEFYYHNTENFEHENGNLIWIYIANDELNNTWNQLSSIPLDSLDLKGNPIRHTLIRFLASKGLRKDREGLLTLSNDEIKAVEKGIANVEYMEASSITDRVHQIIWEIYNYKMGYNPNGHSLTMRLEFWKAAIGIIKENFWLGVGTGDVKKAFSEEYEKINSPLDLHNRHRAHNQFLEIAVALGIIGLMVFLFCMLYPIWINRKNINYFYTTFIIIALSSMLTEDTLETQAGITFFALFNTLLLIKGEENQS